jgi:HEPN domain-containing protein
MSNEKVQYWTGLAEYDLSAAKAMLKSKLFLYVGFMCHQVAEKSFKAFYVHKTDKNPPFTHNLTQLARGAGLYEGLEEKFKALIDILEPLNIEARYPTYKDVLMKSLTKTRCQKIVTQTSELFLWVKKKLTKK